MYRRILSCLMALLLIAALLPARPVSALPESGGASAVQNALSYSYDLDLPSRYTIQTNTTDLQFFGNAKVSISNESAVSEVNVFATYSDLVNENDSGNKLPIVLYEGANELKKTGDRPLCLFWSGHNATNGFDKNGYADRALYVKVTDWSKAKINERYRAEINYTAEIKLADGTDLTVTDLPKCLLEVIVQPMTFNISAPADREITSGDTKEQLIGNLTVDSVSSDAQELDIAPAYTDLINVNDPSDKLSMKLVTDRYGELGSNGLSVDYKTALPVFRKGEKSPVFDSKGISAHKLSAVVSDWSKATPGATYRAEIVYTVTGKNTTGQSYTQTFSKRTFVTVSIPAAKTITSVNITGYRVPTADQSSFVYTAGIGVGDSHLTIKSLRWFCYDDGRYIANSDKFELGKKYQLKAVVEAEKDYVFSKDVKFTANGSESNVDVKECVVDDTLNPQSATVWLKEYTIVKGDKTDIENINLTNYKLPIYGQKVNEYDYENLTLNDVHLKITSARWYNKDKNTVLAMSDKFEANVNYALKLQILCEKGYTPKASTIVYYVNDKTENADRKLNTITETTDGYVVEFWVVPVKLAAPTSKEIKVINITGYTDPKAEMTAGEYKYSDLKPETAANYTLASYEWYDETAKVYLGKDDKFKAGNTYSLKLTVKADKDYTIINRNDLKVRINNEDKLADTRYISVDNAAGVYTASFWTASYTIPAEKKYKIAVTSKGSGTVSVSAVESEAGKAVILMVVPGSDKVRFKEWVVVAGSLTAADIRQTVANGTQYQFTMPATDVQLQAVFEDIPATQPTEPQPVQTVKRLGGATRYDTANLISKEGWSSADTVIIASGQDYPDALAGTVLAGKLGAPILLTAKGSMTSETLKRVKDLGAKNAYILGGKAAVSEAVEVALKNNGVTVTRVAGATRNSTAAEIAYKVAGSVDTVYIVSNKNFADALSVSAGAAIQKYPILYVNPDGSIPAETKTALSKLKVKKAVIIGGPAAVNGKANENLRALGLTVDRIYGSDRYETSIKVYESQKSVFTSKDAAVATGRSFPDALSGAAFAAYKGIPVFLTGTSASQSLIDKTKDAGVIYVFGGTAAVSDSVVGQLKK